MPKPITARCRFEGRFPGSKTRMSYNATVPQGLAVDMSKILVKSFREVVADEWRDPAVRPRLRKLVITITLPEA